LTHLDTKDIFDVMRITDPLALRALSHPLRLDLIELLTALGPATAATCARHLGTSQASCSFHLRQLAKYGFVEQAPASKDRRERPWRLTDLEQSWSSAKAGPAVDQLERVFIQREADRMLGWLGVGATEPEAWRRAAFLGAMTVPVTVDELESIGAQLRAALEPYVGRLSDRSAWPPEARFVRILLNGEPVLHLDREAPASTSEGGTR
jgi:DNA-binding transcriptional ArsR family regulator